MSHVFVCKLGRERYHMLCMYIRLCMVTMYVCTMHMIRMYVLCLVFVTNMKMNLKLVLSYGCSGKGDKVYSCSDTFISYFKVCTSRRQQHVTLEYFVLYTEDRSYVRMC